VSDPGPSGPSCLNITLKWLPVCASWSLTESASDLICDVLNRNVVACGGHFDGTNGTIISPNFEITNLPLNYPLNTTCVWTLTVPFNMSIEMVVGALDLEQAYDYIEVGCMFFFLCIFLLLFLYALHVLRVRYCVTVSVIVLVKHLLIRYTKKEFILIFCFHLSCSFFKFVDNILICFLFLLCSY